MSNRQAFRVELDRPDLYPWVRYLLEVLPGRALAIGFPLVALLLTRRRPASGGACRGPRTEACRAQRGSAARRWLVTFLVLVAAFFVFADNEPRWDERAHWRQIELFLRREWSMEPSITTLPGYHALHRAGGVGHGHREAPVRSPGPVRDRAVRHRHVLLPRPPEGPGRCDARRRCSSSSCPSCFPLFFMVYTDVASLLFVLLTALAASAGRYPAAGVLGLASCLVRQNNIVWTAVAFAQAYVADHGWRWPSRISNLLRYAPVLLSGVAIVGWLVVQSRAGGRRRRDRPSAGDAAPGQHLLHAVRVGHPVPALVVGLPEGDVGTPAASRRRGRVLAATFALFWFGFAADHPYNEEQRFLRNQILVWATASWTHKAGLLPADRHDLRVAAVVAPVAGADGWSIRRRVAFLLPVLAHRAALLPDSAGAPARRPGAAWIRASSGRRSGFGAALSGAVFVIVERGTWML